MEKRRRLETAALFLTVFGALLIVPPLIGVFNIPITIFGMPVVAIYLFAVWTGLIAATVLMSYKLAQEDEPSEGPSETDEPV